MRSKDRLLDNVTGAMKRLEFYSQYSYKFSVKNICLTNRDLRIVIRLFPVNT
jgi:hypothetical protein